LQQAFPLSQIKVFEETYSKLISIYIFFGKNSTLFDALFKLADLNSRTNPREFPTAVIVSLNLSKKLV
jgi:hypothetical protein